MLSCAAVIILFIVYYLGVRKLSGEYDFYSERGVKATLVITGESYTICYKGCRSGNYKVFTSSSYGEIVQFKSNAMTSFGKDVNAPIDPDDAGNLTVVRLPVDHTFFGTRLLVEDASMEQFDYFQRRNSVDDFLSYEYE